MRKLTHKLKELGPLRHSFSEARGNSAAPERPAERSEAVKSEVSVGIFAEKRSDFVQGMELCIGIGVVGSPLTLRSGGLAGSPPTLPACAEASAGREELADLL